MNLKWVFLLYKANDEEKQQGKASLVPEIELAQIFKTRLSYFSISLPYFFFSTGAMWDVLSKGSSGFVRALEQGEAASQSQVGWMEFLN